MISKILRFFFGKTPQRSTHASVEEPFVPPLAISRAEHEEVFGENDTQDAAEKYFMWGLSAWRHLDFNGALNNFNTALEYSPDRADWLLNRGNLLFELGRYADALSDFECSLKIDPLLDDGILFVNYHAIKRFGVDAPVLKIMAEQNANERRKRSAS